MAILPTGVVTFLFSDIEGSTRLLRELGRERYGEVLAAHTGLLREAFESTGGHVFGTEGDALFVAFGSASEAIDGAAAAQRALAEYDWGDVPAPKVRMGVHTGEASLSSTGQYVGVAVHRAARICAAAHGGQVLISHTTRDLLMDEEGEKPRFIMSDLGPQRLKDLEQPLRLYQLLVEGLPDSFPAPRTLGRRHGGRRLLVAIAVVIALVVAGIVAGVLIAGGGSPKRAVPPASTGHRRGGTPATLARALGASTARRFHAVMSPYDYLPAGEVVPGMVLDGAAKIDEEPSSLPRVCGPLFTAGFVAPGDKRIVWSTSRDCNSHGVTACHPDGYPGYAFGLPADRRAVINGRRVFYSSGNDGSNAWACIPVKVNGFADVAVAGMWESNFMTPRRAMLIVANARRLGL
jgi:class 3 adenylate cyclase